MYIKAIELDPNEKQYYSNKAAAYNSIQKFDEAIESADKALKLDKNFEEAKLKKSYALVNKGNMCFQKKDFENALKNYDLSLLIFPDDKIIHSNKAAALNSLKMFDEALIAAERALEIDETFEIAQKQKAISLKYIHTNL
jgi:tetratricopeptide (TPR) repeat protein